MTGEDYEAARPVPTRSGVTGDPWRRSEVIAYLATPIDAHYLRTLLIGLDATVSVNDDGVLVIETPDVPTVRTSGQTTTATAAFAAFNEWESDEDQQYDEHGAIEVCALCGHGQESIGGSADGHFLCHGCDEDHDCYRRWTVYGQRPQPTLEPQPDTPTEPIVMHNYDSEPPVGAVVRCTGCGNVYIHKPHGWLNTDDGSTSPSLEGIKRPSCGPLRVIYTPGQES